MVPLGYESGTMKRKIKFPLPPPAPPTKYEIFCKLRDEMGKPTSPGGTYYPKYSEREAFELAIKETA